jgi:hypothetical protein
LTQLTTIYIIRVQGHLDPEWSAWFGGLTVNHEADGTTTLSGLVLDQAALHGLLIRIRDLGLTLISVNPGEAVGALPPLQEHTGGAP